MARGRLFQDSSFVYDEIVDCTVEGVFVRLDPLTDSPEVIFLKPSGRAWQRFFLDAGIGFWGEYDDDETMSEMAESPVIDYARQWSLIGARLGRVRCEPGPKISVDLSLGRLVLEAVHPESLDSASAFHFLPTAEGA